MSGALGATKKINKSGYLAIVVSNQPVFVRGECTFEEVVEIHAKTETEFGVECSFIDRFYLCPHHTDKSIPGECSEYKCDCSWRETRLDLF